MNGSGMVRVNVTLSPEDLSRVDALAARLGTSRSAVLREALRRFPDPTGQPPAPAPSTEEIMATVRRIAVKAGKWDGAGVVRAWREKG